MKLLDIAAQPRIAKIDRLISPGFGSGKSRSRIHVKPPEMWTTAAQSNETQPTSTNQSRHREGGDQICRMVVRPRCWQVWLRYFRKCDSRASSETRQHLCARAVE